MTVLSHHLLKTAAAGAMVLALGWTGTACAEGTPAGVMITNTSAVTYKVSDVPQQALTASATVAVDRKITMLVAAKGTAPSPALPGIGGAIAALQVTNLSNTTLDLGLAMRQSSTGVVLPYGAPADSFDLGSIALFLDQNGDGIYTSASDPQISFLDEMAADETRTVFVVGNVPNGVPSGATAGFVLSATAREPGASGSLGVVVSATSGPNSSAVDTVLADGAGVSDSSYDGVHSAQDAFLLETTGLTLTKTVRALSSQLHGINTNALIPGARVEFCVIASNGVGNAVATQVKVADPVPAGLTFDKSFGIRVNGTSNAGVCNEDGSIGGMFAGGEALATINAIEGGGAATVRYRAVVN